MITANRPITLPSEQYLAGTVPAQAQIDAEIQEIISIISQEVGEMIESKYAHLPSVSDECVRVEEQVKEYLSLLTQTDTPNQTPSQQSEQLAKDQIESLCNLLRQYQADDFNSLDYEQCKEGLCDRFFKLQTSSNQTTTQPVSAHLPHHPTEPLGGQSIYEGLVFFDAAEYRIPNDGLDNDSSTEDCATTPTTGNTDTRLGDYIDLAPLPSLSIDLSHIKAAKRQALHRLNQQEAKFEAQNARLARRIEKAEVTQDMRQVAKDYAAKPRTNTDIKRITALKTDIARLEAEHENKRAHQGNASAILERQLARDIQQYKDLSAEQHKTKQDRLDTIRAHHQTLTAHKQSEASADNAALVEMQAHITALAKHRTESTIALERARKAEAAKEQESCDLLAQRQGLSAKLTAEKVRIHDLLKATQETTCDTFKTEMRARYARLTAERDRYIKRRDETANTSIQAVNQLVRRFEADLETSNQQFHSQYQALQQNHASSHQAQIERRDRDVHAASTRLHQEVCLLASEAEAAFDARLTKYNHQQHAQAQHLAQQLNHTHIQRKSRQNDIIANTNAAIKQINASRSNAVSKTNQTTSNLITQMHQSIQDSEEKTIGRANRFLTEVSEFMRAKIGST